MRSGKIRDKDCIFGLSTGLQTAVRRTIRHTFTSLSLSTLLMISFSKSFPISRTIAASCASTRCARFYFTERYIQPPIYHLQQEGEAGG